MRLALWRGLAAGSRYRWPVAGGRWLQADGVALVLVLLAVAMFSSMTVGVLLATSIGRTVEQNAEGHAALVNAAESAIEIAARELSLVGNWDEVLSGTRSSAFVDGALGGRSLPDGTSFDLVQLTNRLTCGSASLCSNAQVQATTAQRPWGTANPRWQLFVHQPAPAQPAMPRPADRPYLLVWIGDDGRERDGDVTRDGAAAGGEGRYIVRARAEVLGERGGRYAIEAELVRMCVTVAGVETCRPGVRVRSWRAVAALLP